MARVSKFNSERMISTKLGEAVELLWIDNECYFRGKLVRVHALIDGVSRLISKSELTGDRKNEIDEAVNAALRKTYDDG